MTKKTAYIGRFRRWGFSLNPHLTPTPEGTTPTSSNNDGCREKKEYVEGKRLLRRLTVFVRHENVVRLLEFLGYR